MSPGKQFRIGRDRLHRAAWADFLMASGDHHIAFVETAGDLNPAFHPCSGLNLNHLGFAVNDGKDQFAIRL